VTIRAAIAGELVWGIDHQASIHYQELRPMPLANYKAHHLPITTDCSGWVTCCYYAAGAPDPNGLGYTGQGYTGTMLDHLPVTSVRDALVGDLVVFGPRPGVHVVALLEDGTANGGNPEVASHGHEAGTSPERMRLEAMRAGFPGQPMTVLRGIPAEVASPVRHWEVRNGAGQLLAVTRHPAIWASRHPRAFRRFTHVYYTKRG